MGQIMMCESVSKTMTAYTKKQENCTDKEKP